MKCVSLTKRKTCMECEGTGHIEERIVDEDCGCTVMQSSHCKECRGTGKVVKEKKDE